MKYRDFCGENVSVLGFGGMSAMQQVLDNIAYADNAEACQKNVLRE